MVVDVKNISGINYLRVLRYKVFFLDLGIEMIINKEINELIIEFNLVRKFTKKNKMWKIWG